MDTYNIILIIHISFGFSALITGLLAMLADKKKGTHTITGTWYYYSMLGVFLTSLILYSIKGNDILFLALIAIFSEYQVLTGVRYLQVKNKLKNVQWFDYLVVGLATMTGVGMLSMAAYYYIIGYSFAPTLLLVFGTVMMIGATQDVRFLRKLSLGVKPKSPALRMHIGRMGGAYIATFTAFFVNNFSNLLPFYLGWFLPGIIGGILINRAIKKWIKPKKESRLIS